MKAAIAGAKLLSGPNWLNVFLGIWVAVSPFVLAPARSSAALWNNLAVGLAVALLSMVTRQGGGPVKGALVLLGAWLFASPFLLDFVRTIFLWNNVVLAFVIILSTLMGEDVSTPDVVS